MKIIKFYGGGWLRDFYEDDEIARLLKAVDGNARLLYTRQNAVGMYALIFEVENGQVEPFMQAVKDAMPSKKKIEFKEL